MSRTGARPAARPHEPCPSTRHRAQRGPCNWRSTRRPRRCPLGALAFTSRTAAPWVSILARSLAGVSPFNRSSTRSENRARSGVTRALRQWRGQKHWRHEQAEQVGERLGRGRLWLRASTTECVYAAVVANAPGVVIERRRLRLARSACPTSSSKPINGSSH